MASSYPYCSISVSCPSGNLAEVGKSQDGSKEQSSSKSLVAIQRLRQLGKLLDHERTACKQPPITTLIVHQFTDSASLRHLDSSLSLLSVQEHALCAAGSSAALSSCPPLCDTLIMDCGTLTSLPSGTMLRCCASHLFLKSFTPDPYLLQHFRSPTVRRLTIGTSYVSHFSASSLAVLCEQLPNLTLVCSSVGSWTKAVYAELARRNISLGHVTYPSQSDDANLLIALSTAQVLSLSDMWRISEQSKMLYCSSELSWANLRCIIYTRQCDPSMLRILRSMPLPCISCIIFECSLSPSTAPATLAALVSMPWWSRVSALVLTQADAHLLETVVGHGDGRQGDVPGSGSSLATVLVSNHEETPLASGACRFSSGVVLPRPLHLLAAAVSSLPLMQMKHYARYRQAMKRAMFAIMLLARHIQAPYEVVQPVCCHMLRLGMLHEQAWTRVEMMHS